MNDPFESMDLPEWEREAIDRADRRMRSLQHESHRFADYPAALSRQLRGTWFSCYENVGSSAKSGDSDGENASASGDKDGRSESGTQSSPVSEAEGHPLEEYRNTPLLVHSEKNRFLPLCELIMRQWLPEFPLFLETMLDLERAAAEGQDAAVELEQLAESFGISVAPDHYRIGHILGASSPIFADKLLILDILELLLDSLEYLEGGGFRGAYDPRSLRPTVAAIRAKLGASD